MKILILTDYYPPDKIGGVGEIARHLKETYEQLGHTVFVLTTGTTTGPSSEERVIRSSKSLIRGILKNNLRAIHLLNRHDIALVHMHQSSTTLFLLLRRLFQTFPIVLSSLQVSYLSEAREIRRVHVGGYTFYPRFREYLERFVFAPVHAFLDLIGFLQSDHVSTVSRQNRKELRDTYGRVRKRAVTVIPNGVPLPSPPTPRCLDRHLESQLAGRVVFSYIGVFRTRKRIPNLLLAMRELVSEHPEAALLIVGGGRGYSEQWQALAHELGLETHVFFTGIVPHGEVDYYLSLTDVFCLLSAYEGMPVALLEAMSAGAAIVASDCYGMHDLLADDCGILVPVDDIQATAAAFKSLVRDEDLRRALGEAARQRVASQYQWSQIANQYLKLAVPK